MYRKLLPAWREVQGRRRRLDDPATVRSQVVKLLKWSEAYHNAQLCLRPADFKGDASDEQKDMLRVLKRLKNIAIGPHATHYADSLALMDQRFSKAWRPGKRGTT
jgi:ABC-type nitrate/sulfonate/bicarbonate transport system ATPase subunit